LYKNRKQCEGDKCSEKNATRTLSLVKVRVSIL
jgi:hypothetical protein